jgi:hypothetical protein
MSVQFGDNFVRLGEAHEWTKKFERGGQMLSVQAKKQTRGQTKG